VSSSSHVVDFRVLGPLELVVGGTVLYLGGPQLRALLGVLVVAGGRAVSVAALVEALWDQHAPDDADRTVRTYVSRLRKYLRPAAEAVGATELIVTRAPGYLLRLDPGVIDAVRFERLAAAGRQALDARHPGVAAGRLAAALNLWRGDAFAEFSDIASLDAEAIRLAQMRHNALEDRIDANLAAGEGRELIAELEALTSAHPGYERLWGQLMLALYRAGRQVDALRTFQRARLLLREESGVEPSPTLTGVQRRILGQDKELLLWESGAEAREECGPARVNCRRATIG
jgi:DNA-binding SARP family transcriptional activator